jgi:Rrf2 family transcriptional regulator, iron-sulfur cluster assembly transcription factor
VRVTTRARYAIRALYDLAFHRRGESALAKEIAARQQIPLRFLEQILQDLRRAGLVEARRGPRGGYCLSRAPAEVALADVLRAVGGPLEGLLGVEGQEASRKPGVPRPGERPASRAAPLPDDIPSLVWADVGARLIRVLEQATLADFVARAEATGMRRAVLPATMYSI